MKFELNDEEHCTKISQQNHMCQTLEVAEKRHWADTRKDFVLVMMGFCIVEAIFEAI